MSSNNAKFASDETLGGVPTAPSPESVESSELAIPLWKSYFMKKSWVVCPTPVDRVTPLPFGSGSEEYLRLLRDAQRDSTHSSARHSLASSRRDTPRDSPKSPPNSPNNELSTEDELKGVYINHTNHKDDFDKGSDWIYDWNTKMETSGPKELKLKQALGMVGRRKTYSIRTAKVGKNGLFSKEVIYTLFLTNILSLIIGTGIGVWLTRRGLMVSRITFE
ncbi:BCL2/adenovirus E1B 19 kDa protein-interacting protein 3 isoform X1 [Trichogramma pretiosum]|uniref:BCL2/adenovirus E1B 19 kDa protein-interacting protein 3 n=1 Tax=Trichogramma kaykai TaxID=54128 RepID=A0ABD2WF56_9HYME|nr:BCL2/adenovirus E1B 19 kDa protein-interacting protein 3 isoform X1 [Trichogramma pretiosum]